VTSNRGIIIATIFVGVLSTAVALFIHFDNNEEGLATKQSKNEEISEKDEKAKPSPSVNFAKVFVTPIDTKIPSSFFAEISNTGTASAIGFKVRINFGESRPENCELIPEAIATVENTNSSVFKTFVISDLPKKESLYIVCTTNSPLFKSISVGGGNIEYDKQLTYEAYKEQLNGEAISFYEGLLRVILSALAGIFLFYLFLKLMART
jgi:hypothetical protein